MQNKLHYAITGHTAAELIYSRVDSEKLHMVFTTWKQTIDKANKEYDKYKIKQDLEYISSMDEMYKKYLEENKQ